ncbi:winged helix-turn-helix domain-containing protein [Micromonospora sp. LOL_023]|uniref:winged helix-turn-helix domain-containing protein n=1 Tax=Micromonospora sp. LOL_023 TaxID=3345418 RepID=UPI003A85333E
MAHAQLRFGHYELDLERRQLYHRGRQVPIEPRAVEMLCHLAEHRDRMVPKQELLDAV